MQELNQTLIREGFEKDKNDQETLYHQDQENLCKQEEIFLHRKSRVQCLKEGECNTRFFHRSAMANRARNRIYSIKDEGDNLLNSQKEIEAILVRHFWGISHEASLDRDQYIQIISNNIPKLVSREDNFNLNRLVSKEEVSEVLKEIQNGKAPSLDGFNLDFFKVCQNIVKQDILDVVEDSRRNKTILKALNTTSISLIPKQNVAQIPNRFRPIALFNVVYKIISKVVANRLKHLCPTLLSVEQYGYMCRF